MLQKISDKNSPVAVGALGGSGTRVVAEILMEAGIYMGDNLNNAKDNLTFTCLFKRPEWYMNSQKKDRIRHLQLFQKIMLGEALSVEDRLLYSKAYFTNWNYTIKNKIKAPFRKKPAGDFRGWGWKEPNTHHFLKDLAELFPNLRYIHVVRNGLDMAFSGNVQQLKNFGVNYDIPFPADKAQIPAAQLDYWIKANDHTIKLGGSILGERFYLLKFEELCVNPLDAIKSLLRFLQITLPEAKIQHLATLPKLPSSSGRYEKADLSIFSDDQLERVKNIGYQLNRKKEAV